MADSQKGAALRRKREEDVSEKALLLIGFLQEGWTERSFGEQNVVLAVGVDPGRGITEESRFAAETADALAELAAWRLYEPVVLAEVLGHLPSTALSIIGRAMTHSCLATSSTETQP